jgi:hypothetical protein
VYNPYWPSGSYSGYSLYYSGDTGYSPYYSGYSWPAYWGSGPNSYGWYDPYNQAYLGRYYFPYAVPPLQSWGYPAPTTAPGYAFPSGDYSLEGSGRR